MAYLKDIPQGSDLFPSSPPQIKANYAAFSSIFSRTVGGVIYNHSPMNSRTQGLHQVVLMEKQTLDPEVIGDYVAIYGKIPTGGTEPQLYLRLSQFNPGYENTPMKMTQSTVNVAGPKYQSFVIGGYIVYFGIITNKAVPVVLSPAPTKIITGIVVPNTTSTTLHLPWPASLFITQPGTIQLNSQATGVYKFSYFVIGEK